MTKEKRYTTQTAKKKPQSKKCELQEVEDTEMKITTMKTAPPVATTDTENTTVKNRKDIESSIPSVATIRM